MNWRQLRTSWGRNTHLSRAEALLLFYQPTWWVLSRRCPSKSWVRANVWGREGLLRSATEDEAGREADICRVCSPMPRFPSDWLITLILLAGIPYLLATSISRTSLWCFSLTAQHRPLFLCTQRECRRSKDCLLWFRPLPSCGNLRACAS